VLFTVALASLVYGLIESNERSFSDGRVIGALVLAGALLVVFTLVEWRRSSPMLDLTLFRKPTFTGGAVAAFGLSASLFSLLLYLVLYLQDVLGFSALQTGLRLLVISGGILATSTIAGRLTSHVPVRFLIGPGLALVGLGVLLMRGLTPGSSWTHLVPGMIIAGAGTGLVNPPLASTAIGVVRPENAGMASGINSTFRQVGIATGIALLGSLFTSRVTETINSGVGKIPQLAGHGQQLATAVKSGAGQKAAANVPPGVRGQVQQLTRQAFVNGLDRIFVIAACIAFGAAVIAFFSIRSKDFAAQGYDA
jgi:predicted MFS family arabinose efflux permease